MNYRIIIPGRLPSLNDYTAACRGKKGYVCGALMKKSAQEMIEEYIPRELIKLNIKHKVKLHFKWYEPNDRRDIDNISGFGHKIINDTLVGCGVIEDDDQQHIIGYTDEFYVDKKHPRIEIVIEVNNGEG